MKKEIIIWLIVIISLLIIGCTSVPESKNGNESNELDKNDIAKTSGTCVSDWKCIDKKYKGLQSENCSFSDKVECPLGCRNDTCVPGETCEPGFKCKNINTVSFQDSACQWSKRKDCEFGCVDGECNLKPNETTVEPTTEENLEPSSILKTGEIKVISGNNLSLYLVEEERVKLLINDRKSDWLKEGENYTYMGKITINVVNIFFQSYAGGKQEISYVVK